MQRAKVISFINYKGGVGKTTTTYHIGCSLAQHHGKRVLLIDIDPQTNLTFLCATIEDWEDVKKKKGTIATMYQNYLNRKAIDTKRYIWRSPVGSGSLKINTLDLIPCDIDLLGEDLSGGQVSGSFPSLEALRQSSKEYLRERLFLNSAIQEVEDKYDYVLIDCPPNLYLMTQNALAASAWYVISAIPDHLSTIGLRILQSKVKRIGELLGSAQTFAGSTKDPLKIAQLGGVIFVKVRIGGSLLTATHFSKMEEVRNLLNGSYVFPVYTTELIGYSEAAENNLPVWLHGSQNARRAGNKREYQKITQEFLGRF
ncbi:MAG TPA: ParA family protein [Syntrophorhabdaceae bacterium]|nr:ParA family protein [Syntrophorhabdaceae bacterium]